MSRNENEREVTVIKDRRTKFVGGVIMVGKDKVPHICTSEIKSYRFSDGLSRGMGRDTGWCHKLVVRPLSAEELAEREKQLKIEALKKELGYYTGPVDDDRDAKMFAQKAKEIREQLENLG